MPEQSAEIIKLDSVVNALSRSMLVNKQTGMGTMRDSFTETEVGYVPLLWEQELRSLHRGNWWIRRIIDIPAEDMTKGGIDISGVDDAEAVQSVLSLFEAGGEASPYGRKMGGPQAFCRAEMYARWFGRGYIILRVNGGEDLSEPLEKVDSFEGLSVLDRYQLRPAIDSINTEDPKFYRIARRNQRGGDLGPDVGMFTKIHHTRVLVFDGAFIHPYDRNEGASDGGHDSVIQALYECFCRHYTVQNAIAKGLDSYSLFKVAIDGLADIMMSEKGDAVLAKTLDSIAEMISLHRILVQDGKAANSEFQERSFAGVHENAQGFRDELTAASGLPHYKLWGSVDKAGLSDSGGAESKAWADTINTQQNIKHKPNHRRIFNALFEATTGSIPASYKIEYLNIYKPTAEETANLRKTDAERYKILIDASVVSPEQVRVAIATGQDIANVLAASGASARADDATPTKRILDWNGFKIGLQYFPFDKRHGRTLPAAYGHFQKTKGSDGMAVDVYVGTNLASPKVFVIDQMIGGEFDEEKMVIGVATQAEAEAIYTGAMPAEFMGRVREITLKELGGYRTTKVTKADQLPGKSEPQRRGDAEPFQPAPVTLADIPVHDFGDTDWAEVRSIAEEQGWVWDEEQGQYVDGDGTLITSEQILEVTYAELDKLEAQVTALGDQLVSGDINTSEWEERMAEIVVVAAALFFLFGIGDRNSITTEHEVHLTDRTRTQFEFLRQFAEGILTGEMTADGIKARGHLYVQDAQLHQSEASEFAHPDTEWPFYRSVLGGCNHCVGCPVEAGKGWVRRGELVPIGARQCRWRCCCSYEYAKDDQGRQDSATSLLSRQWGWIGGI